MARSKGTALGWLVWHFQAPLPLPFGTCELKFVLLCRSRRAQRARRSRALPRQVGKAVSRFERFGDIISACASAIQGSPGPLDTAVCAWRLETAVSEHSLERVSDSPGHKPVPRNWRLALAFGWLPPTLQVRKPWGSPVPHNLLRFGGGYIHRISARHELPQAVPKQKFAMGGTSSRQRLARCPVLWA